MACYDAVIIGAGPAGLFCAASISPGKKILVLEKKSSPGRKLLIAGSGRCNLTHSGTPDEFLSRYRNGAKFFKRAFYSFSNTDLVSLFESRGIILAEEENGKFFPASGRGSDVLDLLIKMCGENGVEIRTGFSVDSVRGDAGRFEIAYAGEKFIADNIVIAAGGLSYPATGSSGDGYKFARVLGLAVNDCYPALAPVYTEDYPFAEISGISVKNSLVSVARGKKNIARVAGDILFTHKNLSGPAILDISGSARPGDALRCSLTCADNIPLLKESLAVSPSETVKKILIGASIPERLVLRLLELCGIDKNKRITGVSRASLSGLEEKICGYEFIVSKTGSWGEAMLTAGGVSLEGINSSTMESRAVRGLYVIGETLDIDGATGGYNLQMCFSTARAAAIAISVKI